MAFANPKAPSTRRTPKFARTKQPAMSSRIEDQVLTELRRIIRATQISAKRLAHATGLTTSQLVLLQLLDQHTELTPGQLARHMNLTQATVTSLLDRLQDRALVARKRGTADRRRVSVTLTARGKKLLARSPTPLQSRFVHDFAALQAWEQTALLAALQRIAHLMDADTLDAAPLLDVGRLDEADASDVDA